MIFYWVQVEWFDLKQSRLIALVEENRLVLLEKQNDWADQGNRIWIHWLTHHQPVE